MKKLLPILAVTISPFGTALAADGAGNASDDEKEPTMRELRTAITTLTRNVGTLTGNLTTLTGNVATLTTKVDSFADRGHQVAVVETVPIRLQPSLTPPRAYYVDFYLVGHSTIPGFPSETVAANGKFSDHSAALPQGTYLFELQHPIVDEPKCQDSVSHLNGAGIGMFGRNSCPALYVVLTDGTAAGSSAKKRFEDGFGVYKVTSTSGRMTLRHKFPIGTTFTDRRITSYKGAVKITKLK